MWTIPTIKPLYISPTPPPQATEVEEALLFLPTKPQLVRKLRGTVRLGQLQTRQNKQSALRFGIRVLHHEDCYDSDDIATGG